MTLEEQFTRLIQLLQLIEREPWKWDANDLETKFGVSRATIERDIAILRQWGQVKRKKGKFGLAEMKFLPTSFTSAEALALRIAGTTFAQQAGSSYKSALATALQKIDLALPQKTSMELKKAEGRVAVSQPVVREFSADIYESVQQAVLHHHPVDITYLSRSSGVPTKRRVDPYGLTFKIGAWYMVGYCHLRQDIRTFGLDRIRWLRVEDKLHFRYPSDFNLQDWLKRGWQLQSGGELSEVIIKFYPPSASWISGAQWHPTQVIEKEHDGVIRFKVSVTGWEEMLYWVLSFGADAEVIAPEAMKDAIKATACHMINRYKD